MGKKINNKKRKLIKNFGLGAATVGAMALIPSVFAAPKLFRDDLNDVIKLDKNGITNYVNTTILSDLKVLNGNVGFKTATPQFTVHIEENGGGLLMATGGQTTEDTQIRFGSGIANDNYQRIFYEYNSSDLRFQKSADGNVWDTTDIMHLSWADKHVGIGTNSPSERLHIVENGSEIVMGDFIDAGLGAAIGLKGSIAVGDYTILRFIDDLHINTVTGGDINFSENNVANMFIETGGNVSIGNTSPDARFHITQASSPVVPAMIIEDSAGTDLVTVENTGGVRSGCHRLFYKFRSFIHIWGTI